MAGVDDTSYQRLLSNAWELRQTITKLAASLQDPARDRNDKEDLEIARKAAVAAVKDVHNDMKLLGVEVPFYTWALTSTESTKRSGTRAPGQMLREEVF